MIDTHAHLYMLEHDELDSILERAREAGVNNIVTVSTEESNWEKNREHAEKFDHIYYSLGVHPHEAKDFPGCQGKLEAYFEKGVPKKCVAIGEIGLDYHYEHSTPDQQKSALKEQLRLAQKTDLPVIIHCRNAFADLFSILDEVGEVPKRGVMHCFTGTYEEAKESVKRGYMISFSGILTFKKAEDLRKAASKLPVENLLIETDCPFLTPVPHRGKPNEPSYLPFTAGALALTKGLSLEELQKSTSDNATRLFQL